MTAKPLRPENVRKRMQQIARRRLDVKRQCDTELRLMEEQEREIQSRCLHTNKGRADAQEPTMCVDCGKEHP